MTSKPKLSPPYDGRAVANFILDLSDRRGIALTQMKLLKLIYFSHGWFLASKGKPLILQDFEAWKFGPVIGVVRDAFKSFGRSPITSRAERLDIFTGEYTVVGSQLDENDELFIEGVFESYISYDGWTLSEITHEKDSPWDKVWNSALPIGRLNLRIDQRSIREHFSGLPSRAKAVH